VLFSLITPLLKVSTTLENGQKMDRGCFGSKAGRGVRMSDELSSNQLQLDRLGSLWITPVGAVRSRMSAAQPLFDDFVGQLNNRPRSRLVLLSLSFFFVSACSTSAVFVLGLMRGHAGMAPFGLLSRAISPALSRG
jgi:hypothetical protein